MTALTTYISDIANSDFSIAATGSFFGAVGGYVMVLITTHRTEIFTKITNLKMAIALSHGIFSTFLSLKKQHIKELCENYNTNRVAFLKTKSGKTKGEFEVLFEYKTVSFPYLDSSLINSKLFEKIDLSARPFLLATTLTRAINELNQQINYRHEIIDEIHKISDNRNLNTHDQACLYYGIKFSTDVGDMHYENYKDVMEAIGHFTDDVIWFSKELTNELIDTAKQTAKELFLSRPKVDSIDYTDIDASLMPKDEDFRDWREKFKKAN